AVVTASAIAGLLTIVLLARRRYEPARVTAGVAVATVVAGWALAQRPELLPGLTVEEAAASRAVLWAIVVAAVIGAVILVPSLGYLYSLVLQGRFDEEQEGDENRDERRAPPPARPARVIAGSRAGAVLLPLGALGLFVAENGALRAVSVLVLLVGTGAAFAQLASGPEV
ncbi:MAG: cytochrome bd ubiquinol oxidase subunit, partial [Gaiellaceae bacterium]|nr:cytochrome bd ubiquinol oxidase subunit [Gaiellaceae bacterium]